MGLLSKKNNILNCRCKYRNYLLIFLIVFKIDLPLVHILCVLCGIFCSFHVHKDIYAFHKSKQMINLDLSFQSVIVEIEN